MCFFVTYCTFHSNKYLMVKNLCYFFCRVNKVWYEFLSCHIFPRWAENFMNQNCALLSIYSPKELTNLNSGKICWQFHKLKRAWQGQKKIFKGFFGDNLVFSVKVLHQNRCRYCNNRRQQHTVVKVMNYSSNFTKTLILHFSSVFYLQA